MKESRRAPAETIGSRCPFPRCKLRPRTQQRLVLRFPPEARDGAVVGATVHVSAQVRVRMPGDTERGLRGGIGLLVGKDGGIRDRFNEAGSKNRRGNSENNVGVPALAREWISRRHEVKLRDVATRGVAPSGDDEESVNVAVGGAIAFLEPRFADWAIGRDKPRHGVFRAIQMRNIRKGVFRRARATASGLRVAR